MVHVSCAAPTTSKGLWGWIWPWGKVPGSTPDTEKQKTEDVAWTKHPNIADHETIPQIDHNAGSCPYSSPCGKSAVSPSPPSSCPASFSSSPMEQCPPSSSSWSALLPTFWPFTSSSASARTPSSISSCPSAASTCSSDDDTVDPRNMMPRLPNSAVEGGASLSRRREISSIPKTGEQGEWIYPSPQQFYNAMYRKQKDPEKDAMEATVWVHNVVNETSWKKIMEWEEMHQKECPVPTLNRFAGRYDDLTVKAKFRSKFSYLGRPFDRHDWFVDRCGTPVRYLLDYYDDPRAADDIQVFYDVRPALDSPQAVWDRLRRPFWLWKRRLLASRLFASRNSENKDLEDTKV